MPKLAQLVEHRLAAGIGQADATGVVHDCLVAAGEVAESSARDVTTAAIAKRCQSDFVVASWRVQGRRSWGCVGGGLRLDAIRWSGVLTSTGAPF